MKMKLTIRSDTVSKIQSILKNGKPALLSLSFGKMKRAGFSKFISDWDVACLRSELERSDFDKTTCKIKEYETVICDIGFVDPNHILLYSDGKETKEYGDLYSDGSKYSIILGKNSIDIGFLKTPTTLAEFFNPVKVVYSAFKQKLVKNEGPSIIYMFNSLWDKKQDFPWLLKQGVNYLKRGDSLDDYIVCPFTNGIKYSLFLWDKCAYFVTGSYTYKLDVKAPSSLNNSVIIGYWYENKFTAYDIVFYKGKNVQKVSLPSRLKRLHNVEKIFPFCKSVEYLMDDLEKDTAFLLKKHKGLIFSPKHANYVNNRTFIYKSIETTTINFSIVKKGCVYSLKTGKECSSFQGSPEYPFGHTTPLTLEDQKFVGFIPNSVFKFRWKNNGLVPLERSTSGIPTSTKNSKKIWNYINNPLTNKMVLNIIKGI